MIYRSIAGAWQCTTTILKMRFLQMPETYSGHHMVPAGLITVWIRSQFVVWGNMINVRYLTMNYGLFCKPQLSENNFAHQRRNIIDYYHFWKNGDKWKCFYHVWQCVSTTACQHVFYSWHCNFSHKSLRWSFCFIDAINYNRKYCCLKYRHKRQALVVG